MNTYIESLLTHYGIGLLTLEEAQRLNWQDLDIKMGVREPSAIIIGEEGAGEIKAWVPDDEFSYVSYLHEIGHKALGHMTWDKYLTSQAEKVELEIDAWQWAWDHSEREWTDEEICHMLDCLSSYTDKLYHRTTKFEFIWETI